MTENLGQFERVRQNLDEFNFLYVQEEDGSLTIYQGTDIDDDGDLWGYRVTVH